MCTWKNFSNSKLLSVINCMRRKKKQFTGVEVFSAFMTKVTSLIAFFKRHVVLWRLWEAKLQKMTESSMKFWRWWGGRLPPQQSSGPGQCKDGQCKGITSQPATHLMNSTGYASFTQTSLWLGDYFCILHIEIIWHRVQWSSVLCIKLIKIGLAGRPLGPTLCLWWPANKFSKHRPCGPMLSISRFVRLSVCLSVCVSVCLCVHFWGTV